MSPLFDGDRRGLIEEALLDPGGRFAPGLVAVEQEHDFLHTVRAQFLDRLVIQAAGSIQSYDVRTARRLDAQRVEDRIRPG